MAERFAAAVRSLGPLAVIDLTGDIDGGAEADLRAASDAVAAPGTTRIVLNFGGTTYINSTGIALIVQLLARARADGRAVSAYGLSDHYRQIFEITRLVDFVALHGDEASAVA